MPFARRTTLLLSAVLAACGGINNNVSEGLSAEQRAHKSITLLFNAVNLAEKQGHACVKTAKYVDSKYLQMAISISNKADKPAGTPAQKEKLFYKSEDHALNGLKHINKKHCA